jgi:hypothetical protein
MGLFDSVDTNIEGAYSDFSFAGGGSYDIPSSQSLFPTPTLLTDGQTLIDTRSNVSFWDFDQSKITSSLQDVLGSVTQAAAKSGVQLASDAINRNANNSNPTIAGLFKNFQSTQTGAQIQTASMATRAQNFFANPMVWLGVVLVGAFFLFRR